jgi:DNA-binding transcriptional LysR family regulator
MAADLRRLDLTSLALFAAVADTGSLTAACGRANLALAAGSRRIAELEQAVGAALLVRNARGMRLTAAGEAALAHWRGAARTLERMVVEANDAAVGATGQLRVAASASVVVQFLPSVLPPFLAAHPALRLDLREMTSGQAAEALRAGTVELALMDAAHVGADLDWRSWRQDRLVAVLPPGHALRTERPTPLPFAALLPFDLVGLDHRTALHALLRRGAAEAGAALRLRVQVHSFEAVALLVRAGLGAAVLPDGVARGQLAAGGIARVPLADSWAVRRHVLAARDLSRLPPAAAAFAQALRDPRSRASRNSDGASVPAALASRPGRTPDWTVTPSRGSPRRR